MIESPFFSIVIPVYNAERYIVDSITSLQQQTLKNFEIIVVDDGSNDNTPKICDNLAIQFPSLNIQVVHQTNQRQVAARMKGVDHSCGEYCLFVDADDKLVNTALEEIKGIIDLYAPDIVIYNGERFWENGSTPFWPHYRKENTLFAKNELLNLKRDALCSNRFNNVWNKAFKREIIIHSPRFNDVSFMSVEEDYMMQLPWFDSAKTAVYFPRNLYLYRLNSESITFQKFDKYKFKSALYLFEVEKEYSKKWNLPNGDYIVKQKFLNRVSAAVKQLYNNASGMSPKQKKAYLGSIANNPIFRREYKLFNGRLNSNIGKICLWLLFHHCLGLALYVVEHDPKLHGTSHKISFVE